MGICVTGAGVLADPPSLSVTILETKCLPVPSSPRPFEKHRHEILRISLAEIFSLPSAAMRKSQSQLDTRFNNLKIKISPHDIALLPHIFPVEGVDPVVEEGGQS